MKDFRALEGSAAQLDRTAPLATGLVLACLLSWAADASAVEGPPNPGESRMPPAVRPRPRAVRVEAAAEPAPAPPVGLRQEGNLLIGRTNMLADGIRIGVELSRLEDPPADAEVKDAGPPEPWQKVRIEDGGFDRVFSLDNGMKPVDKLEILLTQEIDLVETVCPLELDRRRKLRLAGQGDIHHFLQEIEDLRPRFDETWAAPASSRDAFRGASALIAEATLLRKRVFTGPFGKNSLFDKNLRRILTKAEYDRISDKRRELAIPKRPLKQFREGKAALPDRQ